MVPGNDELMLHRYLMANLWLPVAPPLIHVKDEPLPNLKAPGPLIPRQSLTTDNRCGQFNTSHREFASRGSSGGISVRTEWSRPDQSDGPRTITRALQLPLASSQFGQPGTVTDSPSRLHLDQ